MGFDDFTAAREHILKRAYEGVEATGDWFDLAADALVAAWRDIWATEDILEYVKDPPGAFNVVDDLTTLTITVAAAGEGVAGTLSATVATSIAGRKIKPGSKNWLARVTAHVAGTAAVTLDAVPEALAAGTAITIFQDEYNLASDLGSFIDGLWGQEGAFVELISQEVLKRDYPDPRQGSLTPTVFARLTQRKILLSHYPTAVRRFEYPYIAVPADPSGAATVSLPAHWRMAWAELGLAQLYEMKVDRRASGAFQRAERLIAKALSYERRRVVGLATRSDRPRRGAYGS